jgi:WD40 repeat protein
VFAGAEDNAIVRAELASGNLVTFKSHDSWVRALHVTANGEELISGGYDGRLIWWPAMAEAPEPIRRIEAHRGWIRYMSPSPDESQVATAGDDKLVKLWNIADGTQVGEFSGHEKNIYSVLFHPDGESLFSGELGGVVKQWSIESGEVLRELDAKQLHTYNTGQRVDFGGVRSLSISPDGRRLSCSGLHNASNPLGSVHEPLVLVFDLESGEVIRSHVADGLKGGVWRAMFHPDGFLIGATSGTSGGFLLFWKPEEDKDFHRLKMPHVARDLDLHRDYKRLATPHYDNHLRVSVMQKKPA